MAGLTQRNSDKKKCIYILSATEHMGWEASGCYNKEKRSS